MKIFRKIPLILIGLILSIIFVYWQFFLKGKIPVPTDLMTGVYYPWLDYKWGFPTGVPVTNPSVSDVFSQFFPWKYLVVEIFKNKSIPLWNQYSFSGTPLLENYHTGVFFPFNIILFLPKYSGWAVYIFGQTLLAAIGMFLLLKHYVKNIIIRFIGALIFSLSGLMTTWVEFGTGVWAAAMLPWIFYFINQFKQNNQHKNLFYLSLAFATLILAGHAQLTLYSGILIAAYLLYLYLIKKEISIKQILIFSFFLLIGIGISCIELIPAFKQVSLSIRLSEKSYIKNLNNGLTPWYDLIRLFVPDFFGHPSTYNYWGDVSYYENSPFLATLTLPFLIPLFFKRFKKKQTTFWLIIFGLSIFLATLNPFTSIFYNLKLPFITYSSASRIFFITSFCGSILGAIGIDLFLKNNLYKKKVIWSSILLLFIISIALLILRLQHVNTLNFKVSLRNSIIPIGLLISLITLSLLKIKNKFFIYFLLFLFFFDLNRYFNKFNSFVDQRIIFPKTPTTEYLNNQTGIYRIGRLSHEVMTPNSWIPYHLSSVEGYDPLAQENYSRFFNRVNGGIYSNDVSRFTEMYGIDFKFINALNVKYLLSVENENHKINPQISLNKLEEVFRDKSTVIYKNPNYKERFYFVNNIISVNNQKELIKLIDKNDFDPTTKSVIVNYKSNLNELGIGNILVNSFRTNKISLNIENQKDGFLVIANSYNPGWTATIDNHQTSIYEIDGALQGVEIQKGKHQITLKYWPKSFDIGLKINIICLAVLLFSAPFFIYKKTW